ncbi:MAG: MFS transporter [Nitrolancea sp.]
MMRSISATIRRDLTRDVAELCAVIFIADVVSGVLSPTFSIFAEGLGVSLALLGIITTVGGLTQLVLGLPIGIFSDRIGRPRVLLAGLTAFILCMLATAAAAGPAMLLASRVLYGVAGVATFSIGAAHLGDITTREQRPFAFGLYTSCMGLGFTIGPLLGAQLADRFSAPTAYVVGAIIGVAGLALGVRIMLKSAPRQRSGAARSAGMSNVRGILRNRRLMLVTFGNMLMSLTFAGGISTFFPIYANELLISQAAIGIMFAVRALVSTLGRLPNGIISRALGSQSVMLSALLLDTGVMLSIAHTSNITLLTVLLAVEGLAFGAYLVSGQTFVADNTEIQNRGAAIGVYSTASSVGSSAAPFVLGLIANAYGVRLVFTVTGAILGVGLIISIAASILLSRLGASSLSAETAEP